MLLVDLDLLISIQAIAIALRCSQLLGVRDEDFGSLLDSAVTFPNNESRVVHCIFVDTDEWLVFFLVLRRIDPLFEYFCLDRIRWTNLYPVLWHDIQTLALGCRPPDSGMSRLRQGAIQLETRLVGVFYLDFLCPDMQPPVTEHRLESRRILL